jgi:hypothetical protein
VPFAWVADERAGPAYRDERERVIAWMSKKRPTFREVAEDPIIVGSEDEVLSSTSIADVPKLFQFH